MVRHYFKVFQIDMISIVICTRNRVDYLSNCLNFILIQDFNSCPIEIIVVDNNSMDATFEKVMNLSYESKFKIKYLLEEKTGLSFARNAAIDNSKYPYLIYIDDDGLIRNNFLDIVYNVINKYDFDCFGGWFVPLYITPKPKWIDENFGYYPKWLNTIGPLEYGKDIPGGIFGIKKEILVKVGRFPVEFGMRGNIVSYGEENFVQKRIRDIGGTIGFVPDLILDHIVAAHKLKLSWHLKMNFAKGRDLVLSEGDFSKKEFFLNYLKFIFYPIPLFFLNFIKLITSKDFYLENIILDSLSYPLFCMGKVVGTIKLVFGRI